jgi:hypothetical protein
MLRALKETQTESDVFFVIDQNDDQLFRYIFNLIRYGTKKTFVIFNPGSKTKGVVKPLNYAARILKSRYRFLTFLGDDNIPRTYHWDREVIRVLSQSKNFLAYPRDGLRNETLPTVISMRSEVIQLLNGFAPENFTHLYVDNFWLFLGQQSNSIVYMPHVYIEHLHPVRGVEKYDDLYKTLNSNESYRTGSIEYENFIVSEEMSFLLNKLKILLYE